MPGKKSDLSNGRELMKRQFIVGILPDNGMKNGSVDSNSSCIQEKADILCKEKHKVSFPEHLQLRYQTYKIYVSSAIVKGFFWVKKFQAL